MKAAVIHNFGESNRFSIEDQPIPVLKDGEVEAVGKLDDLLQTSPEMQSLWVGDLSYSQGGNT